MGNRMITLPLSEEGIPNGLKCFELIEIVDSKSGNIVISPCIYWEKCEDGTYKCEFLGVECKHGDENCKIWDFKKECNVNIYNKNVIKNEFYFKLD